MRNRLLPFCFRSRRFGALFVALGALTLAAGAGGQTLEEELRHLAPLDLAELARREGDALRGAVVFFQPQMACVKCHVASKSAASSLGPDLATLGKEMSDEALIEAVLFPSKVIRKGFEAVNVLTLDGELKTGLLADRLPEKVVLREASREGALTTIPTSQIDDIQMIATSLMPAGQVNQLNSRQQFLDLIKYLMEIRDGGPARARQLQPSEALLTFTVAEYEQHLDHAGLIGDGGTGAFKRGKAIYERVCANCHGTKDQAGSLPTSLRFAVDKFKNGSDPLSMYRTLTHGFGLMAAQPWMVPQQKYDVIHYIRETYLKPHNSTQYVPVDSAYLASLPKGDTRGPKPSKFEPWSAMNYGPSLANTYEVPGPAHNIAYKGIAVRLDPGAGGVSRGRNWILFDTDTLRVAAAWNATGSSGDNFIDWKGIQFDGVHGKHPNLVGTVAFANSTGPGWADPISQTVNDDRRVLGRDGRRYGPLPADWAKYKGMYSHGQQVIFAYTVDTTEVLESPRLWSPESSPWGALALRTFNIGPRERELLLQVADHPGATNTAGVLCDNDPSVVQLTPPDETAPTPTSATPLAEAKNTGTPPRTLIAGFTPQSLKLEWSADSGHLQLRIPAGKDPVRFTLWHVAEPAFEMSNPTLDAVRYFADLSVPDADCDLAHLTQGGPPRWPEKLVTPCEIGSDDGPFAVDILTLPETNPWLAQTRLTGLDFFPDGRLAVCSWDGDVWLAQPQVDSSAPPSLQWQRIASGLFQPLGLKIVDGKIHLTCRDQLMVLHDLNGDGETDFYQCLNNDHQVTEHFHEFAMGLQTDAAGNFYYAKSARHALPAVVPHHGALLRISKDGARTDILANGFRAANGVCLNPDGSFVVTDQEGHWNPKNRINWVTPDPSGTPKFYGNMLGHHEVTDSSDSAMSQPLCWITNAFDRSPAELLWVESDRWGPLDGALLNLSYGYGKVYLVLHEQVRSVKQGGMVELPVPPFPTGILRGRFHPTDGQLYLCGMYAWAGSATKPGGLYRLRATGMPLHLPLRLHAKRAGLELEFATPIDPASLDSKSIRIKTWALRRTEKYGSDHYDEKPLDIRAVSLSDSKTVALEIPGIEPTWCMEIQYSMKSADGMPIQGTIHNTIHELAD